MVLEDIHFTSYHFIAPSKPSQCKNYLVGFGEVTIDNRCVRNHIEVCPKRRTHKMFDVDCMVIMDIYIKSLERMVMSTECPMRKPTTSLTILLLICGPTKLPVPRVMSSIVCQQAGPDIEEMLVV